MKRWFWGGMVALMLLVQSSFSYADSRVRGRWEGAAIALGAVTLYNGLAHGYLSPVVPPRGYPELRRSQHHPGAYGSGCWEVRRVWIPERREQVWIPAHYEHGWWVSGHYEVRVYPGYYDEQRVWVRR